MPPPVVSVGLGGASPELLVGASPEPDESDGSVVPGVSVGAGLLAGSALLFGVAGAGLFVRLSMWMFGAAAVAGLLAGVLMVTSVGLCGLITAMV